MTQRASDEDLARIRRRMRFEDVSGLTVLIALTLGGAAVLIVPTPTVGPVLVVTYAVVFVAAICWMVGYFRTDTAFARIETEPAPKPPWRIYVVAIGAALLTGLAFVLFPQYHRWLWQANIVASIVAVMWVQVRRRRHPSRKRSTGD